MYSVEFMQIINVLTNVQDANHNKITDQSNNSLCWLSDLYDSKILTSYNFYSNQSVNKEIQVIKVNNISLKAKCKQ